MYWGLLEGVSGRKMSEVKQFLKRNHLLPAQAREELGKWKNLSEVWEHCQRVDWLILMLQGLGYNSDPRLRSFACWCARQVLEDPVDPRVMSALETAEKHARGQSDDDELRRARESAREACLNENMQNPQTAWVVVDAAEEFACDAALNACNKIIEGIVYFQVWNKPEDERDLAFRKTHAILSAKLKEFIGDPFAQEPPYFKKQSSTRTVAALGAICCAVGTALTLFNKDTTGTSVFALTLIVCVIVYRRGTVL